MTSCGSSCLRSDAACLSQASLCAPAAPSIHTWHTPTIPLFSQVQSEIGRLPSSIVEKRVPSIRDPL